MAKINLQDGELARMQITKEQEVEISKLYRQTYLGLKKEMEKLSHSGTTSESLRKTYLNKLVKQLKEAYQSIGEGLEKQIQKGMMDTAQAVVDNNSDWLKKAGLKVEGAYSYVPQDIVSLLSSGKLYGEGWSLSKAIWGDSQKKAHDIDRVVAAGVASNKPAYEIAKDLEQYVNPDAKKGWEWSKVYPGTSKKVDYNAQRLARTMVSHAYQQSLLATTKYNPFVTGYKWRSAHSFRRTCKICNERDGNLYSADDLPLDHPNGMCTFLVELEGSLEDVANRLGDWANGAKDPELDRWYQSMVGKMPESVEEPKKPQTPSYTEITPEKAQGYTDELLSRMYGDVNSIPANQIKSVSDYTGDSYTAMNSLLRGKYKAGGTSLTKGQVKKESELLQNLIDSSSLPEGIVTFRGLPGKYLKGLNPGDTFSDRAFTSTSMDRDIALGFVGINPGGVMMRIEAEAGSKAIPATSIKKKSSGYGWLNEAEILFGGGQEFSIVERRQVTLDHDVLSNFGRVIMPRGTTYTEVVVKVV